MTTQNEQKRREEMEQLLREKLSQELEAELIANPELSLVIDSVISSFLDDNADLNGAAPQPGQAFNGTGLIQLIGLAGDAPGSLGDVSFAPKIKEYDDTVTRERISAAADLYYVMQHEILGVFRVVIKLQELFHAGTIQISTGEGAFGLYRFDKQQILRYKRRERFQAYKRLFGYGPIAPAKGARPNTEFDVLFTHFVRQVVGYYQSKRLSNVIQAANKTAQFDSFTSVRRAALDLRNNLKGATYGNITVMRIEAMQLLDEAFHIISAPDILKALGVDSGWDVVEEVSRRYLNQPNINVSQRNRLATAGQDIIAAIADKWVTSEKRQGFEVGLQGIEVTVDEWYTSAQALGLLTNRAPRVIPGKAMPSKKLKRPS